MHLVCTVTAGPTQGLTEIRNGCGVGFEIIVMIDQISNMGLISCDRNLEVNKPRAWIAFDVLNSAKAVEEEAHLSGVISCTIASYSILDDVHAFCISIWLHNSWIWEVHNPSYMSMKIAATINSVILMPTVCTISIQPRSTASTIATNISTISSAFSLSFLLSLLESLSFALAICTNFF